LRTKHIGVTSLTFQSHQSRDHSIPHTPLYIGGPMEPSLYL